jgi:hypothetical protein
MNSWSIAEARANISDVFEAALNSPQKIERRDSESVVVVAESVWNRLMSEYPSCADLVLNSSVEDEDLPQRRPAQIESMPVNLRKPRGRTFRNKADPLGYDLADLDGAIRAMTADALSGRTKDAVQEELTAARRRLGTRGDD